jgi:hypothetical protein
MKNLYAILWRVFFERKKISFGRLTFEVKPLFFSLKRPILLVEKVVAFNGDEKTEEIPLLLDLFQKGHTF